ncbi:hypothetical protein BKA80DRAFT_276606 [Phyllosticta citrichinensis]
MGLASLPARRHRDASCKWDLRSLLLDLGAAALLAEAGVLGVVTFEFAALFLGVAGAFAVLLFAGLFGGIVVGLDNGQ